MGMNEYTAFIREMHCHRCGDMIPRGGHYYELDDGSLICKSCKIAVNLV